MMNKEVIKKSLGFSLIFYFLILLFLLLSLPFSISIMIENRINLDDFLLGVIMISPFFYLIIFTFSYLVFKKDINKSEKSRYEGICISVGKHAFLIITIFVLFCLFLFYSLIFYFSDVTLKGFFVCSNDFTFSKSIKSYGDFNITNRGVCVKKSTCEKLEGFVECEELKDSSYYSKVVIKGANKNNFDFKFLTGLKKTENSKEEFIISDLDDEFNLPKYTCTQTMCDFNTSGKIDFYEMKRHGMLIIKDGDVAIPKPSGLLIFKDVDLGTFQYLDGKYSKDKNNVYYKNEIISADSETFIYEKGRGKAIGKGRDENGTWIKGLLQEK